MNEEVSTAAPSTSGRLVAAFITFSVALFVVGVAFAGGVVMGLSQTVLGVVLAIGFALLAGMLLLYYRMTAPHRILVEYDEELW
ncbi:MAG: hypothetical protein ABEI31_10255 [Halodesulfurarchaeum sp.]